MGNENLEMLKQRALTDFKSNAKIRISVFRKFLIDLINEIKVSDSDSTRYDNLFNLIFGQGNTNVNLMNLLGYNNLLSFMLGGVKVKLIELQEGSTIGDYFNDYGSLPPNDRFFEVKPNEIVVFKGKVQLNDFGVYDAWEMHLFKKGAGKWGVKGGTNQNPDIKLSYQADFIMIDRELFITESLPSLVLGTDYQSGDYQSILESNGYESILDGLVKLNNNIHNLEGINYTWNPTNRTLTLYDNSGNQLSQVSLVSLDNEGTDLRYNDTTLSLELYNADNELLDSIPVSSFIGSVGTQLQLNSNQLQLKDSQGNVLSTVGFSVSNIQRLQSLLDNKLEKSTYNGNAQDLKNSIDGKLNKPTATSNTTSYTYVVGEDGNGNSARLPAGDLGKNFFNSDLRNTTARNHTMNAGVTVNTLGNPHTLAGLPNKNTDITNFRKVRVQNTSGLDSVVDSKNLLTDGVTSMSDAEKDSWRLAQRKSTETYSVGQPRIDLISPTNINNSHNYTQYVSVIGLNLYINTGASIVKLVRIKDENGISVTPEETVINASSIQTFSTNFQILVLGINFFGKAKGYYKIYITSFTGLTNLTSPEFFVEENFIISNFNPVSFNVVNKYANSSDYVSSSEIYHINLQQAGKATLEKSVKSNALFNFQNGFLYEFNFEMYLVGSYTNASFNCGFSNGDFDITNGYTPQAFLGVGGDYGHMFTNSATYKEHNQPRGQVVVVKCIFFNKNGVTTITQLTPNGVVLVSSMVQNYNIGDPIRFYANFYSYDGVYGSVIGQNFKIQFPSTYQSF